MDLVSGVWSHDKAPLERKKTDPNPTDRGKRGTKRSLWTDGRGMPLGVVVDGASRLDMKLLVPTLSDTAAPRPEPDAKNPQHLCLDKGYDYPIIRKQVTELGYVLHFRSHGEEKEEKAAIPGYCDRRWVVEWPHSWMNRFRCLLIRWKKKVKNYEAMFHFACAWICFRCCAEVFG